MSNASDFVIENGILKKYTGPGGDVVIPEGVTSIGNGAFDNRMDTCLSLTSVTIPEGVTSIGFEAFYNHYKLTNVTLPGSVTSIGDMAFAYCRSMTSVMIPESVTEIGSSAFSGCSGLTSVTIPESLKRIGDRAFYGCDRLTSVTIPEGVTSIGGMAFYDCNRLTSVTIPGSVETIGKEAFSVMTSVVIEDISLLPASDRPKTATGFAERGGNRETPGFASYSKYIKSNAAKLVEQAMKHPALLKLMCQEKLITPKNVELYVDAAQKSGDAELIAMMLDYQANKVSDKQKETVEKQKKKEQDAVFDRQLSRQGKEGIEGLNIAVTGDLETFSNRNELKAFLMENGAKLASSLTAKVDYLIMNRHSPESAKVQRAKELGIEVITEQRFNEMASRAFALKGTVLTKYCGTGGIVIIPESVTSIDDRAFSGCSSLTSVTIPTSVTSIGDRAFSGCSTLTSVTIPESVTSIGHNAFTGCSSLTSVTIPEGVTSIGGQAFSGCSGLTGVTIPESVTSIGYEPFWGCKNLTIHTPAGSCTEQYAKENHIPFVAD